MYFDVFYTCCVSHTTSKPKGETNAAFLLRARAGGCSTEGLLLCIGFGQLSEGHTPILVLFNLACPSDERPLQ